MDTKEAFDAIIIGSGQGATPLAIALAHSGKRTALVEREYVGGTCINVGCTPTKTMVASARVAYLAGRAAEYGVETGPASVDLRRVIERKRKIVDSFRHSGEHRLLKAGIDLIRGEASFTGSRALRVRLNEGGERFLSADWIFIDTGSRPVDPPLPGLDQISHLNSTTIMELEAIPEHLIVLGGGYVGMEFGQMFRRFGSDVTIVQKADRLMGEREDKDIADEVAKILSDDGIEILLNAEGKNVERSDRAIRLTVQTHEGIRVVSGSHLLVAVGRKPNTEVLDLPAAGIATDDRGYIQVDDCLETNVHGVYAIGDVTGAPQFTHLSYDDYRILCSTLLRHGNRTRKDRLVPYTVFIDPQLGRIGLTEEQARKEGKNILVAKVPMSYVTRAIEVDETRGVVKAVIDADTGRILGCAVLGIEGGEIMAMIEIAMLGNLNFRTLRDGIFAHPTLAELLNTLFTSIEHSAMQEPHMKMEMEAA